MVDEVKRVGCRTEEYVDEVLDFFGGRDGCLDYFVCSCARVPR